MANRKTSVAENAPGAFFVDRTCIDCDTCRQIAPAVFGEAPGHAFVRRQPTTPDDRRQALHALVCCPTGSIGSEPVKEPRRRVEHSVQGGSMVSASLIPTRSLPGRAVGPWGRLGRWERLVGNPRAGPLSLFTALTDLSKTPFAGDRHAGGSGGPVGDDEQEFHRGVHPARQFL